MSVTTYSQHLACLGATDGKHCTTCNRDVTAEEVQVHHSDHGWRHITCGRLIFQTRNGLLWCDGWDCTRPCPDPIELRASDPLSAEG